MICWSQQDFSHTDSPTVQDVVGLFEPCLQVPPLDGSDWLIEGLGSNGLLSIKIKNLFILLLTKINPAGIQYTDAVDTVVL